MYAQVIQQFNLNLSYNTLQFLDCLKAASVSVWSGVIGLLREPDFWIPWVILSSIFVRLGGGVGQLGSPVLSGCPDDQDGLSFFQNVVSLVMSEEKGFLAFPSLPQG